jgi:hypothetical protein
MVSIIWEILEHDGGMPPYINMSAIYISYYWTKYERDTVVSITTYFGATKSMDTIRELYYNH